MLPTFSQNLTFQEAFETVAQIKEELAKKNVGQPQHRGPLVIEQSLLGILL